MTEGTLTLTAIEAKLTRDTEIFGKMDPFVIFNIGEYNSRTKILESAGF